MTPARRVLLVDPSLPLQRAVGASLRATGYVVALASTGNSALRAVSIEAPDLVVLDLDLPDIDGAELCTRLRSTSEVPLIVLTAAGEEQRTVAALDRGASDFLGKPFGPEDLLARIHAALYVGERGSPSECGRLSAGSLELDLDRRTVHRSGVQVKLSPEEFDLLAFVARRAGQLVTHRAIAAAIGGPGTAPAYARALITRLRKQIEPDSVHPRYVIVEPWIGCRFTAADV